MLFDKFSECLELLENTSKRLDMFDILAGFFKEVDDIEIQPSIYIIQGMLAPSFKGIEIGMSTKLVQKAIGYDFAGDVEKLAEMQESFNSLGDLGLVAEKYVNETNGDISIGEVFARLTAVAELKGAGSVDAKVSGLNDILKSSTKRGAKYIAKFVTGSLRLGVGNSTILEALGLAKTGSREFKKELENAFNICSDLGLIALTLSQKGKEGIRNIKPILGYPIRMALCERLSSAEEIIKKLGECTVEVKYDGFRIQVHKIDQDNVEIFSRNLEKVTHMFPEVVEMVKTNLKAENGIIEGEAISYDRITGALLPFQITIQRKRKTGINEISERLPLRFFVFDLLYLNGEDYTAYKYVERRAKLSEIINPDEKIGLSEAIRTDNPADIETFFNNILDRSLEGIVAKRHDASYAAGARNFNWIKLKKTYLSSFSDTVDICIIGYDYGRGTRAEFGIGAVLGAVYDNETETFKTIAKIGTGFTEANLSTLKQKLEEIKVSKIPANVESTVKPDVWVSPKYIMSVAADEITRSPLHTCGMKEDKIGYALRFPRAVEIIRQDKGQEDATTVKEIISLYQKQIPIAKEEKGEKENFL